jgi:hypothetical protein
MTDTPDILRGIVKPGEIERAIWPAMIWAAANNPGFEGAPEYTDRGNSFAESEARAAAARVLASIDVAKLRAVLEALHSVEIYGSDTLSGRIDGPNDAAWYREGVREMRSRANRRPRRPTGAKPVSYRYCRPADILAQAERELSPRLAFEHAMWLRRIGYAPYFDATFEGIMRGNDNVKSLIWC